MDKQAASVGPGGLQVQRQEHLSGSPFLPLPFVTTSEHSHPTQHPEPSENEKELNSRSPTSGKTFVNPQCYVSAGLFLLWMSSWSRGL